MKKTITLEGFMHAKPADKYTSENHVRAGLLYKFWEYEDLSSSGWIKVCPLTVTFDVQEEFDPISKMVEILQKKKVEIMADMTQQLTAIDRQINELLAIENV